MLAWCWQPWWHVPLLVLVECTSPGTSTLVVHSISLSDFWITTDRLILFLFVPGSLMLFGGFFQAPGIVTFGLYKDTRNQALSQVLPFPSQPERTARPFNKPKPRLNRPYLTPRLAHPRTSPPPIPYPAQPHPINNF